MGQESSKPTSSTEEEDFPREDGALIDTLPTHGDPNKTMQTIDEEQEQKLPPTKGGGGGASEASSETATAATHVPAVDGDKQTTTTVAYETAWENSKKKQLQEDEENGTDIVDPNYVIVDLDSMKDSCYFLFPDKKARLSRFWLLLLFAAVIATSGLVSDAAATVIGAMVSDISLSLHLCRRYRSIHLLILKSPQT